MTSPTPLSSDQPLLHQRLYALWRRQNTLHLLDGGAWVLGCVGALLLLQLLGDWLLHLPGYVRAALALIDLAALIWIVQRRYWRHRRSFDPVRLALYIERNVPGLHSLLVSAVQFGRGAAGTGGSPALVATVKQQAEVKAAAIDHRPLVDWRTLRPPGAAAGATVAVTLLLTLLQPRLVGVFALRMFNPWSAAAYPTRTTITEASADLTIRQGDPLELKARVAGQVPKGGQLWVQMPGAAWERIELRTQGDGAFAYLFDQVASDFDYYFHLGDAQSPRHHVTVVAPPHLVQAEVDLHYPAYAQGVYKDETARMLNVKVQQGTQLTWRLAADRAVDRAEVVFESKPPLAMALSKDAKDATAPMTADASTSYHFRLHWHLGQRQYADDSPHYFIRILPETDPRVEITYPSEDDKATLQKMLTVQFHAEDDYGLDKAWLIYAVNDRAEQRKPLDTLDKLLRGQRSAEPSVQWPVKQLIPDLREGDIVTLSIEVSAPRANPEGHTGRSRTRRIQFVSNKDYLEYVLARQRKFLGAIRPLYLQERDAGARMDEAAPTTHPAGPVSAADPRTPAPGTAGAKETAR